MKFSYGVGIFSLTPTFFEGDFMEEIVLKCAELGALGIFSLLLLTKGLSALNSLSTSLTELSKSQEKLAESVTRLTEKIYNVDSKVENIKAELQDLKADLFEVKQFLKSLLERKE